MRTSPHTLIVTDHHYSGKMLVSLIGVAHKTYLAEGSAQGLALFCRHAPDIVLLDLQETAEQAPGIIQSLRAIDPHIFIAMVAVNADMANTPGVNNFIVKPFTTAKLHAMIELLPRRR